jgi:hypothetical protein
MRAILVQLLGPRPDFRVPGRFPDCRAFGPKFSIIGSPETFPRVTHHKMIFIRCKTGLWERANKAEPARVRKSRRWDSQRASRDSTTRGVPWGRAIFVYLKGRSLLEPAAIFTFSLPFLHQNLSIFSTFESFVFMASLSGNPDSLVVLHFHNFRAKRMRHW